MKTKRFLPVISKLAAISIFLSSSISVQAAETNDSDDYSGETCTYYFLAPEDWCMEEYNAENKDIGCYWWIGLSNNTHYENMIPAPEVGKNIYKITDVPAADVTMLFTDGVDYSHSSPEEKRETTYTGATNTYSIEYSDITFYAFTDDLAPNTEITDLNGWIFVLDRTQDIDNGWDHRSREGLWFPLNTYKNNEKYFGSYPDWYSEENRIFGDLDADDKVTSSDALTALRLSVGIDFYNAFTLSIADGDKDGALTSLDALTILRSSIERS